MEWTHEANQAISRVPFFVRKRVRKRVEEEALQCRAKKVDLEHVQTCQKRFLNRMEEEVKGYQVETCFGPGGCPNRAVVSDGLAEGLEKILEDRNLKTFLKERVEGPLKMHHEFRISISDCPNACSRPQIVDVGLIGSCMPQISAETCSRCFECMDACKEGAITVEDGIPALDMSLCLSCGQCVKVCSTGTLLEGRKGYRLLTGGKLGRHPRLGAPLGDVHEQGDVTRIVEKCLDHYQHHNTNGERFGEILERTGMHDLEKKA